MAREITKAQRDAVSRYEAKNYDKTLIRLQKGTLDRVRAAADVAGQSLNGYIAAAIDREMAGGHDGAGTGATGYRLPPADQQQATTAAKDAGEDLGAWISRAIKDQADRDKKMREIFKR